MGRAHTGQDQRYTEANKINNMRKTCSRGRNVNATQSGNNVTVKCGCGVSSTTQVGGIYDAHDAIAEFNDKHR